MRNKNFSFNQTELVDCKQSSFLIAFDHLNFYPHLTSILALSMFYENFEIDENDPAHITNSCSFLALGLDDSEFPRGMCYV